MLTVRTRAGKVFSTAVQMPSGYVMGRLGKYKSLDDFRAAWPHYRISAGDVWSLEEEGDGDV